MNKMTFEELMVSDGSGSILESAQPFMRLMMQYQCALREMETKFEVLRSELSLYGAKSPLESITCRIKSPQSIMNKLRRKGLDVTVENIEKHIHDVAGLRVICPFPRDIDILAEKICSQDDVRLLEKKDYIRNPKENGYRSLHLILEVPVFFADEKKPMPVEVQLRTIAMDFWASIEHKVQYKSESDTHTEQIMQELRSCAEEIHAMDLRMQDISRRIDSIQRGEIDIRGK